MWCYSSKFAYRKWCFFCLHFGFVDWPIRSCQPSVTWVALLCTQYFHRWSRCWSPHWMWKANLLRSVFAGIGALKHGDMAVVWTMRVMRSELWVCELCIFPLVPTRNHRVQSNFWKAWRFTSVVSPSPCDSLVEDSAHFRQHLKVQPFFKPQNGIDMLENHESAPRLPLLSIVHDCTDVWWKETCTASYFWTFIPLPCSAQACWLYGWLVSSFVSAPTWYSFVWTLAILI